MIKAENLKKIWCMNELLEGSIYLKDILIKYTVSWTADYKVCNVCLNII